MCEVWTSVGGKLPTGGVVMLEDASEWERFVTLLVAVGRFATLVVAVDAFLRFFPLTRS